MQSSQSSNPIVDLAFYGGLIVCISWLFLKLATIVWQFLTGIWQACVLLFAAIISTLYFVKAFGYLWDTPMRTDVDLEGVEDEEFFFDEKPAFKNEQVQILMQPEKNTEKKIEPSEVLLKSPVHRIADLKTGDHYLLERAGYVKKEFVPLGKTRRESYYVQKQKTSLAHTFVVHSIIKKLQPIVKDVEVTQNQDIKIFHKGKYYALTVVTPADLHKHNKLTAQAKVLTKTFGANWWFFITKSAYAKSFGRYGLTITRNQINDWIQENFS